MPLDEQQLWDAYRSQPSIASRNALIEHYLRYVHKIAIGMRRKIPPGASFTADDLVGYGIPGLVEAIEKFDASRGCQFITFAAMRVRGAMLDGIRREDWVPRLVRQQEKRGENTAVRVESIENRQVQRNDIGETTAFEHVDHRPSPAAHNVGLMDRIRQLTRGLNKQQRIIFLLYHVEGLTMREIGRSLDLSDGRISQIHAEILCRIKDRFGERGEWLTEDRPATAAPAALPQRQAADPPPCESENPVAPSIPRNSTWKEPRMSQLIELLNQTTAADIRAEIEQRRKEIATLEMLLRVLDPEATADVSQEPDQAGAMQPRLTGAERRAKIAEFLKSGPAKASEIASQCGIGYQSVHSCLKGDTRFEKQPDGRWANAGQVAAEAV